MSWTEIVSWVGFVIGVIALALTVYAVYDARKMVRRALELQRNLSYTEALNQLVYDFVEQSAGSLEWTHLHKFVIFQRELEPTRTLDSSQLAATYEALWVANELVTKGMASWRPDIDVDKVRDELKKWQNEKNNARMKLIFGDVKAFSPRF
jgi:hypothetical protein